MQSLFGTSASTPVASDVAVYLMSHTVLIVSTVSLQFAGIIALINNQRLSVGLPVLGFLNPFLYWAQSKDSTAFNDVISGNNVSLFSPS